MTMTSKVAGMSSESRVPATASTARRRNARTTVGAAAPITNTRPPPHELRTRSTQSIAVSGFIQRGNRQLPTLQETTLRADSQTGPKPDGRRIEQSLAGMGGASMADYLRVL